MLQLTEIIFRLRREEGHYATVTHRLENVLYILIEDVENNLIVKYYVRMANINKVIRLSKLKFTVNFSNVFNGIKNTKLLL